MKNLLTRMSGNNKLSKDSEVAESVILQLAPYDESKLKNLCPKADQVCNKDEALQMLKSGINVAIIFDGEPDTFVGSHMWGKEVINGVKTDLRSNDCYKPDGTYKDDNVIVGLSVKGNYDASAPCHKSCLSKTGMNVFSQSMLARFNRTKFYLKQKEMFLIQLDKELTNLSKRASKRSQKENRHIQAYARLNGLSDQRIDKWEIDTKTLFERHPNIQFYDYTKMPHYALAMMSNDKFSDGLAFPNYHVTFSMQGVWDAKTKERKGV
jgi:hypothetical protein